MNLRTNPIQYILIIFLLTLFSSCSKTMRMPLTYKVIPNPPEVVGKKVTVEITGKFLGKTFDKKSKVVFTPLIEYDNKKVPLSTIVIKGEKSFGTNTGVFNEKGPVILYKEGGEFKYKDSFIYKDGMEHASITVTPKVYRGKKSYETATVVLTDRIITNFDNQRIVHDEHIYFADRETAEKLNMDTSEYYETISLIPQKLRIFFEKGSSKPNYDIPINRANTVRLQLNEMSSFINKDTWKLEKVEIRAYCSPDGEEAKNPNLCTERANVGRTVINDVFFDLYENLKAKVKIENPESVLKYTIEEMGPDWVTFNQTFAESEIDNKDYIVSQINLQNSQQDKENKIAEISKENKDFESKILAVTRRVEVDVYSYKPKLDSDTILYKALNQPSSLFNTELLYAATLTNDINEKEIIYKNYTKLFPQDWKGLVNLANILLLKDNVVDARDLYIYAAEFTQDNPIIMNNLGVCMIRMGKLDVAKKYFYNAFKLGADVRYNSGLVSMLENDYEEAEKLLKNQQCNLNTVITYMATAKLDKAKATALCCKDSFYKYYLLALISAKSNEKNETLDYINKAVKISPQSKSMLKSDATLYKYF